MTPARLAHAVPGRARLRLDTRRGDRGFFDALCERLSACPALERVEPRVSTGSLILSHRGELAPILAWARSRGLFDLQPAPEVGARPQPAREGAGEVAGEAALAALGEGVQALDSRVRRLSGGTLSLPVLVVGGLFGLGLLQLSRGNVLVPAISLFRYAWRGVEGLQRNAGG